MPSAQRFPNHFLILLLVFVGMVKLGYSQEKSKAEKQGSDGPKVKINDDPLQHVKKKNQKPNGLIRETSPYLLMHAYNPVQWKPWNKQTLAEAKKSGKPIFLSIGYSSCHWCHVMERESFMDKDIAKYLNENFICIKVDREERPDVDSIYMTSLSVFNRISRNGGGTGWPLSMFLTPDAKPFFGGTYFPARDGDRGARIGFYTILKRVDSLWGTKEDAIRKDAEFLSSRVQKELDGTRKKKSFQFNDTHWNDLVFSYLDAFDSTWGGFGYSPVNANIPKFPQPGNLLALLEIARQGNKSAGEMLYLTLNKMHHGGMWDHVGSGFHRYSVDRYWRIPHYEKMLYDNGQLASVYAEAYAATKNPEYARVAKGICRFVLDEMTHPQGGFYSALDAESEGEEGKYYVWSRDQIQKILGITGYQQWGKIYQVDQTPNFEGKFYSPQLIQGLELTAKAQKVDFAKWFEQLEDHRKKLKSVRDQRERPLTDTKVLTSWNGLMIRGMADTGRILKDKDLIRAAERAADFIHQNLRQKNGRLQRSFRNGKATLNAYLDDYAFLIDGLVALHQATGEKKWLDRATRLQETQNKFFWDSKRYGYFFTSDDHQSLLARAKNPTDGARPSGNSISALNLIYLAKHTGKTPYRKMAQQTVDSFAGLIEDFPRAVPLLHVAAGRLINKNETKQK